MRKFRLGLATCLLIFAGNASALQIFLTGPGDVAVGDTVELDFWLDVSDLAPFGILGGGAVLSYDPSLVAFNSWEWSENIFCTIIDITDPCDGILDPFFSQAPSDAGGGLLSFLGFARFEGIFSSDPIRLGTFSFDTLGTGLAGFGLDPDTLAAWASNEPPFDEIQPEDVDALGLDVNISTQSINEPSTLALIGLGLVAVALRRRLIRRDG